MGVDRKVPIKPRVYIGLLLFGAMMLTLYNNCGQSIELKRADVPSITSIGNPMDEYAKMLSTRICTKLTSCHTGLTMDQCEVGIGTTSGIAENLGLPVGRFTTYNDLIIAEKTHRVVGSEGRVTACGDSIEAMSCQDPKIINSYSAGAGAPFLGVASLVASQGLSCGVAFNCRDCQPSPSPTPTPSQGGSPTPTPTPASASSYCYYDLPSLTVGASYSCNQHGDPATNILQEVRFVAGPFIELYSDPSCTNPRSIGINLINSTSEASGLIPNSGIMSYGGLGIADLVNQTLPCTLMPTSYPTSYTKLDSPLGGWTYGYCVWISTDPAGCPP